jgi:hypothetical protein
LRGIDYENEDDDEEEGLPRGGQYQGSGRDGGDLKSEGRID